MAMKRRTRTRMRRRRRRRKGRTMGACSWLRFLQCEGDDRELCGEVAGEVKIGRVENGSGGGVMLSVRRRREIASGRARKESSIFRGLLGYGDTLLVLLETGAPRTQSALRVVQQVLEEFALQGVENKTGRALSGGELASNCAGRPPNVLLVDEPFAGEKEEDSIRVLEIQKQLRRLCDEDGVGVLTMTDLCVNEALRRLCDRAYMVHYGCFTGSGALSSLELCQDLYVKEYYLGEGFQRWEWSFWSPLYGW